MEMLVFGLILVVVVVLVGTRGQKLCDQLDEQRTEKKRRV